MGFFSGIAKTVAGPLVGAAVGGLLGGKATRETNRANANQAQLNRQFQERMSSTAHQREVEDLRKAGLNPILSSVRGGSSTPGGAQATFQSTAADVREGARMGALISEQIKNIRQDTQQKKYDTQLKYELSETEQMKFKLLFNQMKQVQEQTKSVSLDNKLKQIDVDFYSDAEIAKIAKSLGIKPELMGQMLKFFKRPLKAQ